MAMHKATLKAKLQEYKRLKEEIAELQDLATAIEDDIKALMGECEELTVDGVRIKYTRYITNRFDTAAFKAKHAKMFERFIKPTEGRRLSIA